MMTFRIERKLGATGRKGGLPRAASRGFTLIELLVVIAIISILASIVYASLGSQRAKGRDARRVSELHSVATALEANYDQTVVVGANQYLAAGNVCLAGTFNNVCWDALVAELVTNGLLPAAFDDPSTGRVYSASVRANAYVLGSDLERTNIACASDWDGGDANTPPAGTLCVDTGANCTGTEVDLIDFCVRGVAQ